MWNSNKNLKFVYPLLVEQQIRRFGRRFPHQEVVPVSFWDKKVHRGWKKILGKNKKKIRKRRRK
jgi:hypothetical protein